MKRQVIYVVIISILLTLVFVNIYLKIESGTGFFVRLIERPVLTVEERNWLQKHGNKITYGADYSSPPLRYVDEENGQYTGFIVDYITALSFELGVEFEYKPLDSWNEALTQLSNRQSDFFDMIPSDLREKQFDFTDSVYLLRGAILVPAHEKSIIDYRDLSGKVVAVPKGDYAIEFLQSRVDDIQFINTKNMQEAILTLQDGKADAVVGDEPVIIYYRDKLRAKDTLKILDNIMYEQSAALAVPKSEKTLLSILNKGVRILKQKELLNKIQQKWFGISIPSSSEKLSQKITLMVTIFFSILLLIVYLFYHWNGLLKKEVEKRTRELNISREKLQITFDGLTHLMIVIDRDFKIQNVNDAFCNILGIEKEMALKGNLTDFQKIFLPDEFNEIVSNTFDKDKHETMEYNKKGRILKITAFPLKDEITPSILIMIEDITQIRIGERQLLQNRKMAAIGQLAAGVAHEIRNPLGLIRNYCYLLKNNPDQGKLEKSIKVIESSVERASGIINNLLNFSRISGNKMEQTNIRKFMAGILALEEKVLKIKNIDYDVYCEHDLLAYVNQESLKHILTNLVSNAVDAMPQGGRLIIRCYTEFENLIVKCVDTGIGIDEDNLKDIFNPFFTTKDPGKGTGLGLYIVFNEVQKCGGDIKVSSKPGAGTTFCIKLPLGGDSKNENK